MYQIVVLMGEAGSGKDTIMQEVLKATGTSLHEIVSCTTRPKRDYEVEGINYFFLTPEQFGDKVLNDEMLECTVFNDWFYGTSYEGLRVSEINIGVFNPAGVYSIIERPDVKPLIFWIQASDKTRLLRQLNREKDPNVSEIIRRFGADKKDFSDIDFECYELTNETEEDKQQCVEFILDKINTFCGSDF